MLLKTTLRAARSRPTWVRRRWCDVSGHVAAVRSGGPYTAGYARCGRCDRVLGPGA
ncbi:hypothetical protein SAMN04488543_1315 [Friedmanniella luteola]|uniref:Uncharacterized protein n=1 Tax=Friedmanniella luteola TaxID=546871 RepID=A0A1H1QHP9_9ACTN|nr:hypothetical protein [Friedmanniella luteola]SDS22439.1 hypothetical protein SAMN04488543_1315 [Friedmanniella luteola]